MGAKSTPESWEVVEINRKVYIQAGNRYVAEVLGGWADARRDAAKIAAVPKMFEALKRLMSVLRYLPDDPEFPTNGVIHALGEAAIALDEAEGRTP